MTTPIHKQHSDDPLAPFALPDILRPDGPLETRLRTFNKSLGDWQHQQFIRDALNCLDQWRKMFQLKMTKDGVTVDQVLYEIFTNWRTDDMRELFAYCLLEASQPDRPPFAFRDKAARLFNAKRELLESTLGDFVSKKLADAAAFIAKFDNYHADPLGTTPDFSKVNDCDVYLYLRQRELPTLSTSSMITTGIPLLDDATGGLHGLIMVGGHAGGGKSAFSQFICLKSLNASKSTAVIIHQFDMSKPQCFDRLLCALGGVTEKELRDPNLPPERQAKVDDAIKQLQVLSPRIDIIRHSTGGVIDVPQLIKRRNQFLAACGCNRAVVIIDYFQLVSVPDDVRDSVEADKLRIEIVQMLQKCALHCGSSTDDMLVISEVRKTDGGGPLGLSDLLGSSRIGYAADTVLMLQQTGKEVSSDAETASLDLRVVKTRGGRKTTIPLMFDFLQYRLRAAEVEVASGRSRTNRANWAEKSALLSPIS